MKLFLFLSLISMSLSFSVLVGSYTKSPLNNRDSRFNNALSLTAKRAVMKYGEFEKVKVYPIAAYRQIVNGVNYKIINIIKDEENKKVELVASDVHTDPDSKEHSVDEPFYIRDDVGLSRTYALGPENGIFIEISGFLSEHLIAQNINVVMINTIYTTTKIVSDESYYLVNTVVFSEGKFAKKYLVLNHEDGKGFSVIDTTDFN